MEGDAFREILRAVSQENPETIARKVHEAFCDRDLEAVVALWAEDCEYEPALEREIGDGRLPEAWKDWDSEVHEVRLSDRDEALAAAELK